MSECGGMKKILSAFALSILALACANTTTMRSNGIARVARSIRSEAMASNPVIEAEASKGMPVLSNPGDYVVVRFSGSYRKAPITLSQRVLSREGTVALIELVLSEGKKSQTLRA